MARLSKEERAELEARLAADDDTDDDDDEVEYGFKDGGYIRGKASRVRRVVTGRGEKFDPDPEPEPEDEPKTGKRTPAAKDDTSTRFGRRVG